MRKKLIEVALPLDAINAASARENRHGHPSTLHLWWARRPLAAVRAVIFAQMVDDPLEYVDVLLSGPWSLPPQFQSPGLEVHCINTSRVRDIGKLQAFQLVVVLPFSVHLAIQPPQKGAMAKDPQQVLQPPFTH